MIGKAPTLMANQAFRTRRGVLRDGLIVAPEQRSLKRVDNNGHCYWKLKNGVARQVSAHPTLSPSAAR